MFQFQLDLLHKVDPIGVQSLTFSKKKMKKIYFLNFGKKERFIFLGQNKYYFRSKLGNIIPWKFDLIGDNFFDEIF